MAERRPAALEFVLAGGRHTVPPGQGHLAGRKPPFKFGPSCRLSRQPWVAEWRQDAHPSGNHLAALRLIRRRLPLYVGRRQHVCMNEWAP